MTADPSPSRQALYVFAGPAAAGDTGPARLDMMATPELRLLARRWLLANKTLTPDAILSLLDELMASNLHVDKTLAALILS